MGRRVATGVLCLLLAGWVTDDVPLPPGLDPRTIDEDCGAPAVLPRGAPVSARGRAIGTLDQERCEATLREGGVPFERVDPAQAEGVAQPIRLRGAVGGVRVTPEDGVHAVLDCRLATALLAWAPALREQGIARLEHVSIYRPNARVRGTRRISGHAHALAIDALAFVLDDGTRTTVLDGWVDRERGADPCAVRGADDVRTARMRAALCAAVQQDLFQVVLTPHHDPAHANHLHLEVRPGVAWSFVR
jgi:hypothetical protein